jgi:hypothetical protein
MALSDIVAGFPVWLRITLVAFAVVVLIPLALYLGEVVAPAVTVALTQGRAVTLGPISFGEFEEPAVKECKLRLQNTNDSLNSLHLQVVSLVDLLKSQDADIVRLTSERNALFNISDAEQKTKYFDMQKVLTIINGSIASAEQDKANTQRSLLDSVNHTIEFVNSLAKYCLDYIQSKNTER